MALPIAQALNAPLEPMIVRKIGHPLQPELGVGALTPDGQVKLDRDMIDRIRITEEQLQAVIGRERMELQRRQREYGSRDLPLAGKTVLVVDDGLATGVTAQAAGEYLKRKGVAKTVLAIPVCAPEAADRMKSTYDEVICPHIQPNLSSVGQWYADFRQLTDRDVLAILAESRSS